MSENKNVICSSCGEVVPPNSKFCNSCGARLTGGEKTAPVKQNRNNAGAKNGAEFQQSSQPKQISKTQLIYLIVGLVVVGVVLLLSTGILNSDPHPAVAEQQSGTEQQGGDNKLAAIQEINAQEDLVKNNPDKPEYLLTLAHMLNDNGFYQRAIDKYQQYLKIKPKEADVIVDMGVCYYQLGKFQDALANFKKGIELNPKHQIAHMNMGVVYNYGMNNKAEAIKWWKKTVALDSTSDVGKRAQEFLNQNK